MTTTRTTPTATTYRPGQPIEAQFGPSGWTPATYAAFRLGQHLIETEAGNVLPAHPDKIRAVDTVPADVQALIESFPVAAMTSAWSVRMAFPRMTDSEFAGHLLNLGVGRPAELIKAARFRAHHLGRY